MSEQRKKTEPQQPSVERRQGRDWVTKWVSGISLIGWFMVFVVLLFLERARPAEENLFTRYYDTPIYSSWNTNLLWVALLLLLVVFAFCVIGFFLNMTRHRRKSDRFNRSILILGGITIVAAVVFLLRFYTYLL